MDTEKLIARLAADVRPVPRHSVARWIALGLGLGAVGSIAIVLIAFGMRQDWSVALVSYHFWVKWLYTLSLGLGAILLTARLARPDPGRLRHLWLLGVPVMVLATIGIVEMSRTAPGDWLAMWLGGSWRDCPRNVLLLSMPMFVGLLWAYRHFAPTSLRAAGAAAGLASGAFGAAVYCIHCPEVSAIFVLTWYTLGIALASALGALIGPRLMRW
ncbi:MULTISPECIES: DUF1109 domain-containing protein [unclassified Sphingobium]|uniref:DUF1109 domain-containing protein n=1 Tax=unclassified Sphingobium TaxID=2611147 RepID=UPI0035A66786